MCLGVVGTSRAPSGPLGRSHHPAMRRGGGEARQCPSPHRPAVGLRVDELHLDGEEKINTIMMDLILRGAAHPSS